MKRNILISQADIQKRVGELGNEISTAFKDQKEDLILIGILKGSFVFLADLVRSLEVPFKVDFMEVSSYGSGTKTTGEIKIVKDLRLPLEGKNVLLVEDIVDTGLTLDRIIHLLATRRPNSISVCSLLYKPSRKQKDIEIKFLGFEIEDRFVVGYGLDFDENYRGLKDIVIYSEE